MDFLLYEPEDFASNESYLRYYFKVSNHDVVFWDNWICNHPEKQDIIKKANELISFLNLQLPDNEYNDEYHRIISSIHLLSSNNQTSQSDSNQNFKKPRHTSYHVILYTTVACALTLFALFLFRSETDYLTDRDVFKGTEVNRIEIIDRPQLLTLADGTIVRLSPGATLTYPIPFKEDKREVYLNGEAFFDVISNSSRPFYVYSGNLVTHVLGTSFIVKADKANSKIEVQVITGRVEVVENTEAKQSMKSDSKSSTGVILTPNQKVVYSAYDSNFETGLVVDPKIVQVPHNNPIEKKENTALIEEDIFVFSAIPLSVIIPELRAAYNIEIEVENSSILNCHFSGDLSKMNLYRKLDIICKSLNYSYEIKGTKILIRGSGCN